MLKPLVILGLAFSFGGCATNSSAPAAGNTEAKQVATDDKKKKVICKRAARVGTHFKTTQCWTAEEYAQRQKEDKEAVRNMQNSAKMKGPEGR